MQILVLAAWTLAAFPPPALAEPGVNGIVNSSFEQAGENGNPTGWKRGFWPGELAAQFTYPVPGAGGEGSQAASVSITSHAGQGDAKWYFEDIPATPLAYYIFSDKYKSDAETRVLVRLNSGACTDQDQSQCSYIELGRAASSSDWTDFSAGFTVPSGVTSLTVFHTLESNGTLTVDDYSVVEPVAAGFPSGMVSLVFDDGWYSVYENGLPILDAAGYKSTQYLISDMVGQEPSNGYLGINEALAMQAGGHELGGHTATHGDLSLMASTSPQLFREVLGSRFSLIERLGAKPFDSMAYAYGKYNDDTKSLARQAGFLAARTVEEGFNTATSDRFALKSLPVQRGGLENGQPVSETTLEEIQAAVDSALAEKTWLILTFHQIDDVPENVYGISAGTLQAIVDYLVFKEATVVTVSEALRLMPGVPALDSIAPQIASSSELVVEAASSTGAIATFLSPVVSDNQDAALLAYCSDDSGRSSGSLFPLGTSTLACRVADSSGNLASSSLRVLVRDTTPPVIALIGSSTMSVASGTAFIDPGVTVTDLVDGNIATTTVSGDVIGSSTPAGTYTVKYDAKDAAGNAATQAQRTVVVGTPPSNNGNSSGGSSSGGGGGGGSSPIYIVGQPAGTGNPAATSTATSTDPAYNQPLTEGELIYNFRGQVSFATGTSAIYDRTIGLVSGLSETDRMSIARFISEGTESTKKLGAGERAGTLHSYFRAFGRLPRTAAQWQDVVKIGAGRWTAERSTAAENAAIASFRQIYRRSPDRTHNYDENAIQVLAYGLRPVPRNLNSERAALASFRDIYGRTPSSTQDWDILRAIAYSGAKR